MKNRSSFNPNVHGARGLFCLIVFIFHAINSKLPTFSIVKDSWFEQNILYSGMFGVELFFGISGIVIVGALTKTTDVRVFLWDRLTRILPTLGATLVVLFSMSLAFGNAEFFHTDRRLWIFNFLAPPPMFNIPLIHPAAWSLGYEFTFYYICALGWFLKLRGLRLWLWPTSLLGLIFIVFYPRALLILAGVLIGCGIYKAPPIKKLSKFPSLSIIIFLLCWRHIDLMPGGPIISKNPTTMDFANWLYVFALMIGAGIIGGLALAGIFNGTGWLGRFLRTLPMQWMGQISYSFYLWHPIVMAAVKRVMYSLHMVELAGAWSQICFALASLPPALILSWLSEKYLERKLTLYLRQKVLGIKKASPPATTAAMDSN